MTRACAWCRGPIPATTRRDAICCSTRCRQARHRFTTDVGRPHATAADEALRLAYADPPYPGLSARYYSEHPDFDGEVDHTELIRRLSTYDGWALSTSARALPSVLALCPPGVRVAAWFRGERPTRSEGPLNAWEPVIYFGGRASVAPGRDDTSRLARAHVAPAEATASSELATRDDVERDVSPRGATRRASTTDASEIPSRRIDALVHVSRPRTTDTARVIGAKPAAFCGWMFQLLGALPGDNFTDLFPGSGGVTRAWATYAQNGASPSNAPGGAVP